MKRWFSAGLLLALTVISQAQTLAPLPSNQQLLVWDNPDEGKTAGKLVLLTSDTTTDVLTLDNTVSNVVACGTNPTSLNGRQLAIGVTNNSRITLYQMTDNNPALTVLNTEVNGMTCVGDGLQYNADGTRVGYLMWPSPADTAITLTSRLLIQDTQSLAFLGNFDDVTDFSMTADGAVFVTLFRNAQGDFVEAGINVWDGSSTREITTLFADQENKCSYGSASVSNISDSQLAVMIGFRCQRGETSTQYQIYTVNTSTRAATLTLAGLASGQFFDFTRTNNVYLAPNANSLFQFLPDNFSNSTSRLIETPLTNPGENILVLNSIQMPQLRSVAPNGVPQVSPNGQWLAAVGNDANNNATLYAVDMNNASLPPIELPAASRGDRINSLHFTSDNGRLFYVSGIPENNIAYTLDLTSGVASRIGRGRYVLNSAVLSPTAPVVAVTDIRTVSDKEPPYNVLQMIDLGSNAQTDLLAGAEIVDGKVINTRTLTPIAWRRPG